MSIHNITINCKRILFLVLLAFSSSAFAEFKLIIPLEELRSKTWLSASPITSEWVASGSPYSCGAWSPNPVAEYEGVSFEQTRTCQQDYERTITAMEEEASSGQTRVASINNDTKTEAISQTQINIGMLDPWLSTSSTYTAWSNVGSRSYASWTPSPSNQTANFNQSRSYTQNQERYEQKREQNDLTNEYRNIGDPIRHTRTINGSVNRTVVVSASPWSNSGGHYNCGTWSPSPSTQTSNYSQGRNCSQDQSRTWTYTADGSTIHARIESRTVSASESRTISVTASSWANDGSKYACEAWSPGAGSQTSNFTQSRDCSQDQTRTWTYKSGASTLHTRTENQTITVPESRSISVTKTAWANDGSKYGCTTWSPAASSQTTNFTQNRNCSQKQTRTWIYKAGASTLSTRVENQTITVPDSRSVTTSVSGWSNDGAVYGCGSWSPGANSQTSSFTQTGSCSQDQTRTWSYKVGATTIHTRPQARTVGGSDTRTVTLSPTSWVNSGGKYSCGTFSPSASTQTSDFTQTRSCSQNQNRTMRYIAEGSTIHSRPDSQVKSVSDSRVVDVSVTGYANTGSVYGCGSWSPAAGSQASDFTQTGSCSQDQTRTWSYKAGATTLSTRPQTRTVGSSSSRLVTVTAGSWVEDGPKYNVERKLVDSPDMGPDIIYSYNFTNFENGDDGVIKDYYDQDYKKTINYVAGGSTIASRTETKTEVDQQMFVGNWRCRYVGSGSYRSFYEVYNDSGVVDYEGAIWSGSWKINTASLIYTRGKFVEGSLYGDGQNKATVCQVSI